MTRKEETNPLQRNLAHCKFSLIFAPISASLYISFDAYKGTRGGGGGGGGGGTAN